MKFIFHMSIHMLKYIYKSKMTISTSENVIIDSTSKSSKSNYW